MTFLVTFIDGHSTLVASREAAEQIAAYWPELKATIRDLDQEARDREELILCVLKELESGPLHISEDDPRPCTCPTHSLLKRLGRLP